MRCESISELRQKINVPASQIAAAAGNGGEVGGYQVSVEESEDGDTTWIAEPVDKGTDLAALADYDGLSESVVEQLGSIVSVDTCEELEDLASQGPLTEYDGIGAKTEHRVLRALSSLGGGVEQARLEELERELEVEAEPEDDSPRLEDSDVHGRTVNGLADAGLETAEDLEELIGGMTRDEAVAELTDLKGVGEKGARQAFAWLMRLNGDPKTDSAYPGWVYDLDPDDISAAKQAVDAARTDGEIPRVDDLSDSAKSDFRAWLRDRNEDLGLGAECPGCGEIAVPAPVSVDKEGHHECSECGTPFRLDIDGDGYHVTEGHEIRCPHCEELFDVAPVGVYEDPQVIRCKRETAIDPPFEQGDCGQDFALILQEDAYETHAEHPELESSDGKSDASIEDLPDNVRDLYDALVERIEPAINVVSVDPRNLEAQCRLVGGPALTLRMDSTGKVSTEVADKGAAAPTDDLSEAIEVTIGALTEEYGGQDIRRDQETDTEGVDKQNDDSEQETAAWPDEETTSEPAIETNASTVPKSDRPHPLLTGCQSIAQHEHGTDAWHNTRSRGIGSSDVGAILGFDEHADTQEVWADKVEGEEVPQKPWLEGYSEFGRWFERYIREWCEDQFGDVILPGSDFGTLQSAAWPRALANIDGLNVTSQRVEEIKTTSEEWTSPPEKYKAQVQHQMFVTGLHEANIQQFVCPIDRELIPSLLEEFRSVCMVEREADRTMADWLLEQGEIHTWVIERDESFIERMLERERDFWTFVEEEVPPPEADPEGTLDLTDEPDLYATFCRYARLDRQVEEALRAERNGETVDLEDLKDEAKSEIKDHIEEHVALADDDPKRVRVGDHTATLVEREEYSYWRLYPGEGDDVPL